MKFFLTAIIILTISLYGQKIDWLSKLTGNFNGYRVVNKYKTYTIVKFNNINNKIKGQYQLHLKNKIINGEFIDCKELALYYLECKWRDNYGNGKITFIFDEKVKSFKATWYEKYKNIEYTWIGNK